MSEFDAILTIPATTDDNPFVYGFDNVRQPQVAGVYEMAYGDSIAELIVGSTHRDVQWPTTDIAAAWQFTCASEPPTPAITIVDVPVTPGTVNDDSGVEGDATWDVPSDDDTFTWVVDDEGNLIVTIIAEDTTFSDGSTSHNYGPAVDVYEPPTIIECPEDKVPGWLDESGTPQGCVDNSPAIDPPLPSELTPPVVVQKPVGGVESSAVVSTKEPVVASSSASVVEGSLPRTGAEGLIPVVFGLLFVGGALLRLRRTI